MKSKRYFDIEHGKEVKEDYIKKQYNRFCELYTWFTKSYEDFKEQNFREIENDEQLEYWKQI